VLANISLVWALSRGGLVRVAPLQFAQPVCALFFASALLNERLTSSLLFVAAAIVFGIVTASRGASPTAATRESVGSITERARSVARFLSPWFLDPEQGHKPLDGGLDSTRGGAESAVSRRAVQSLRVPTLVKELT
jgi:hypothetical protein